VFRFSETGVADSTFSSTPFLFGGNTETEPQAIALQSNGQIVVGGLTNARNTRQKLTRSDPIDDTRQVRGKVHRGFPARGNKCLEQFDRDAWLVRRHRCAVHHGALRRTDSDRCRSHQKAELDWQGSRQPTLQGINLSVSKSSIPETTQAYVTLNRLSHKRNGGTYAAILDFARLNVRHPTGIQRFLVR
jgi:hypothetical protein